MSESTGPENGDSLGPASYPTPTRLPPDYSEPPRFVPDFRSPYADRPFRPSQPMPGPDQPYPYDQRSLQPGAPFQLGHPGHPAQPGQPVLQSGRPAGKAIGGVLIAAALLAVVVGGGAGYLGARLGGSAAPDAGTPAATSPVTTSPGTAPGPASVPQHAATPVPPTRGSADAVTIAERTLPSTVTIRVTVGDEGELGSGFVLDHHGRIMTNNHVVADAARGGSIMVSFSDGHRSRAEILGRSPSYDLAVIQVANHRKLHPADLGDSGRTKVGEAAIAIGSPLGLGGTVTEGIVSAINRPVAVGDANSTDGQAYLNAIQTDAPINHGNSGGPLVNGAGEVIGVNSAILTGSSGGQQSGNIGIGFAIPINQARQIGDLLIQDGHATYPVINATVTSNGSGSGVTLSTVTPGGAADKAGLRSDDVITAVNGHPVGETEDLIVAIRNHRPGDVVTLEFERNGNSHTADVRLGSKRG
ncbi:S1C family serine protease [Microlunatus sp. Gsoil 973]|uniref:S1C family serine protease n=1 Tax=Microlunatus sp. Gsoil 973 TaxID=2672569 RepID=UPI0012B46DE1|nr:trypsin-like peptidase domain-containing protein [Microlunatus sp. Gsoil 973]QGN33436.1 PDZ domain-containing protein [Microlunatus sp. Gsoil 973]